MTTNRMPPFSAPWTFVALLAFACAGCSAPVVKEPAEKTKDVGPSRNATPPKVKREPETPKEPVTLPKPQTPRPLAPNRSEEDLERGVGSYEDGEYKIAAKQLQNALDIGLDAKRDRARAHKYLAFINCVSGREKSCRDGFRKALDADPKFDLDPAEAGHPIWGPVFRRVKSEATVRPKSN